MNAPDARRGGLEVWAPSVVPPIGVELSKEHRFEFGAASGYPLCAERALRAKNRPNSRPQNTFGETPVTAAA
jgi:hypothetical protein